MSVRYWHGGMPGLRVGDLIEPGHERATAATRSSRPPTKNGARGVRGGDDASGVTLTTTTPPQRRHAKREPGASRVTL